MNFRTLILRSLVHYARTHFGVVLGAAVSSAVLVGALAVGDSVRQSLLNMALSRLGKTQIALQGGDRLFRHALAQSLEDPLDAPVAALLQLPGVASASDGSARANQIQVLGVDAQFWSLAGKSSVSPALAPDEAWLNTRLALHLGSKVGDTVVLRVARPSALSRDAPIAPQEDSAAALRVRVAGILGDDAFGRFSLQASQLPPFNAFVSLTWLQERLQLQGKANLILAGSGSRAVPLFANAAVARAWTLDDASLMLRNAESNRPIELRTERVFLDAPIVEAALKTHPSAHGVLTYFVNRIARETNATPYSMVTATDAPWMPRDLLENEILITPWLAEDLQAKPGQTLSIGYYVVGDMRKLEERTASFTVRAVLPESGPHADPTLMPDFPGLAAAKNCRDWDAGFPIAFDRIRDKDNAYWEKSKGTPKAFISLKAGRKLWENRFGNLTAVRFPDPGVPITSLAPQLLKAIDPSSLGLRFEDVRTAAIASARGGQDFGQLFLGFSFFLVVAALILTSLLFQFGIEQRSTETGLLLALGWPPSRVRNLLLAEGALLALLGAVAGLAGGIGYAKAMLWGLSTLWKDAVGASSLAYHAEPLTLLLGLLLGWVVATGTLGLAIRSISRRPARELLAPLDVESAPTLNFSESRKTSGLVNWVSFAGKAGGVALVVAGMLKPAAAPGLFFGAGALLLISSLASLRRLFDRMNRSGSRLIDASSLALRNLCRRPKRSLAVAGLLACGSFMIVAVSANRLDATRDSTSRQSGTGGFSLLAESSLPVVHDLNGEEGRSFHGLDKKELEGAAFLPMRVREGEDASCLNLNRALTPRILGVDPARLDTLHAFAFARVLDPQFKRNPWKSLDTGFNQGDPIPAIGDAASIQWALGKSLGDTLDFVDERGRPFQLRLVGALAGSILQGQLLISEKAFVSRFPSATGYRMFLIDAPSDRVAAVRSHLSRALQDVGMELTPTVDRLAAFNAVQNTYLNTFQALGGLGLLLGSLGVGVVVLRTILERRSELALLGALGWSKPAVQSLLLKEHLALFAFGMLIGALASGIAVLPALANPNSGFPLGSLALTLAVILVNGALWVAGATWSGTRGELLKPLRQNP